MLVTVPAPHPQPASRVQAMVGVLLVLCALGVVGWVVLVLGLASR